MMEEAGRVAFGVPAGNGLRIFAEFGREFILSKPGGYIQPSRRTKKGQKLAQKGLHDPILLSELSGIVGSCELIEFFHCRCELREIAYSAGRH